MPKRPAENRVFYFYWKRAGEKMFRACVVETNDDFYHVTRLMDATVLDEAWAVPFVDRVRRRHPGDAFKIVKL